MSSVYVTVGNGCHVQRHSHFRFYHHETRCEYGLVAIVLICNGKPVVASYLQAASVIWYLKSVVCIQDIGVDGFCQLVNGVVGSEALAVVACE